MLSDKYFTPLYFSQAGLWGSYQHDKRVCAQGACAPFILWVVWLWSRWAWFIVMAQVCKVRGHVGCDNHPEELNMCDRCRVIPPYNACGEE